MRTTTIETSTLARLVDTVEDCANVSVSRVFADREFHAVDVIAALEERDLFYVIPAARDDRSRFIARMGDNVRSIERMSATESVPIW